MTKRTLHTHLSATVALIFLTSLIFWFKPSLDIGASQFFYKGGFPLQAYSLLNTVPIIITKFIVVLIAALLLLAPLSLRVERLKKYHRNIVFLLLSFLIAPVLLVNVGLKTYSGRPRPQNISYFKGQHDYQKVWVISSACDHNCSFVCGDCAAMFCFVAFAFIAKRKKLLATVAVLQASFFSFLRLGLGKHFLSDILLAWLLVYLVILLVYYFTFLRPASCKTK